jgi:hypothetical protein
MPKIGHKNFAESPGGPVELTIARTSAERAFRPGMVKAV